MKFVAWLYIIDPVQRWKLVLIIAIALILFGQHACHHIPGADWTVVRSS